LKKRSKKRFPVSRRGGDIVIELFENQAPNSVANFISLINKGFYNGLAFHRVLAGHPWIYAA